MTVWSHWYLPKKSVKMWLKNGWGLWQKHNPKWFDETWRKKMAKNIPSELLPDLAKLHLASDRSLPDKGAERTYLRSNSTQLEN